MQKEYRTISEVVGALMLVNQVEGVKYDELVEIVQEDGTIRRGKVLEVNGDRALVQLFEGSQGLRVSTAKARFMGRSIELDVAPDMLGRVFDGMGKPKDGGPALITPPPGTTPPSSSRPACPPSTASTPWSGARSSRCSPAAAFLTPSWRLRSPGRPRSLVPTKSSPWSSLP